MCTYSVFENLWIFYLAMLEDGKKMLALIKLNFILFLITLKSTANNLVQTSNYLRHICYILMRDKAKTDESAFKTYKKMKNILNDFSILPLSEHNSLIAYLILKKVPHFVWKNLIPFPSFLFEDTFAKSIEGDTIYAQLPPPEPTSILMVKIKEMPERAAIKEKSPARLTTRADAESPTIFENIRNMNTIRNTCSSRVINAHED